MRRLILMRHAEAERSAPDGGGDRARPLSARGRADAQSLGQSLLDRGFRPDRALVSGAVRTRQTWDLVQEALGDLEVEILDDLYNAEADVIRHAVEDREDSVECLAVVAHNPGVHLLAVEYLADAAASPHLLDRMAGGFPPGSAAIFGFDAHGRPFWEGWLAPGGMSAA